MAHAEACLSMRSADDVKAEKLLDISVATPPAETPTKKMYGRIRVLVDVQRGDVDYGGVVSAIVSISCCR